jgi:hypothetical protein
MSYVKRMLHLPTSRAQQLVELAIIAALAFSLGMAVNAIGRGTAPTTVNDQVSGRVVTARAWNQPAVAVQRGSVLVRVPYEAGWTLYDDGWAGGPATRQETSGAAAPARVPYEAGWTLYDDGWAGGPRTAPPTQTGN